MKSIKSIFTLTIRYSEEESVKFKTWAYSTMGKAKNALREWTDCYKRFYADEIETTEEEENDVQITFNDNRIYRGYVDELFLNEPSAPKLDY